MIVTHRITKDLVWHGVEPRIDAVQGDANTREVEITLTSEGQLWAPPAGAVAVIGYSRPDGCGGQYDTLPDGSRAYYIGDNSVTVTLIPQALAAPGAVVVQVNLIKGDQVLGIFPFRVNVAKDPALGLPGADSYFNFQQVIKQEVANQLGGDGTGGGTAGLPIPPTAEVGQYIVVAEVDSRGKVTATRAEWLGGVLTPAVTVTCADPAVYVTNDIETAVAVTTDLAATATLEYEQEE